MQPRVDRSQPEYEDFQDYQAFESHQGLNKKEMFAPQFLDFMGWFKRDVHSRYTKKDFQRLELANAKVLTFGYVGVLLFYLLLHRTLPQYALFWGVPLFAAALYFSKRGDLMHMRTHSPNNLTGLGWVDGIIDNLGLGLTGLSPALFGRRHLAAHYNDIGNLSKVFSKLNFTFDKVPVSYYLRPHLLVKFLLDKTFLRSERLNRRTLFFETLSFYVYLVVLVWELTVGSYFLLAFHLVPGLLLASSQLMSGTIVHSSCDPRNSFESNGLFDWRTATGLFKVPLWLYSLFNNGFFENHGIHHAYPQVPLEIINKDYKRYHTYILNHYQDVRYNRVMAMTVQADLLERLGSPNFFDYIVTFFLSVLAMVAMLFTVMGLPVPPTVFELVLVDYRIYLRTSRVERSRNRVRFFDQLNFTERYQQTANPNTYLKWTWQRYCRWKADAAT